MCGGVVEYGVCGIGRSADAIALSPRYFFFFFLIPERVVSQH